MPVALCSWCQSPLVGATVLGLGVFVCPQAPCRSRQLAHVQVGGTAKERKALFMPLPSQVPLWEAPQRKVLWGGQAGPGKSTGARRWLYDRSLRVPGHEALILRENWEQLDKTHLRKMEREVEALGGRFFKAERKVEFGRGSAASVIDCGHMADGEAVSRYLSTEYHAIVADEASLYPLLPDGTTPLSELSTRARVIGKDRETGADVPPRFLAVTNPGGPSAGWLREMFIDQLPDYERYPALKPGQKNAYRPSDWLYIPARLDDNPYLDPDYESSLAVLNRVRYEQLRNGDWTVFSGQFFSEWSQAKHVRRVAASRDVDAFASCDWGYNAPGCFLVWLALPDGHLHIVAELKFQALSVETVADRFRALVKDLGIRTLRYVACDPSMKAKTGHGRGESIMETLLRRGVPMRASDNDRVNGWLRVHELLQDAPDGTPWLTVDPSAKYLIRTLPSQMSDKHNLDDIDTNGDDHAVDALRYGAMSRPSPTRFAKQAKKLHPLLEEALLASRASAPLGTGNVRPRG